MTHTKQTMYKIMSERMERDELKEHLLNKAYWRAMDEGKPKLRMVIKIHLDFTRENLSRARVYYMGYMDGMREGRRGR